MVLIYYCIRVLFGGNRLYKIMEIKYVIYFIEGENVLICGK